MTKTQNFNSNFFKKFEAQRKIFGIKNSKHVFSYPKIKKNWSKSRFFNIVGGVLKK